MKPLSVGDVVSAGLRIYRDNFKKYFKLAIISYLWLFVPIYGWAKYSGIMGIIARLAFQEIAEQPETVRDAQRYVEPRKWYFFVTGILISSIFSAAIIPYLIIFGLLFLMAGLVIAEVSETIGTVLVIIVVLAAIIGLIFGFIWLASKFFLVELPLAVEDNTNAVSTLGRSWQLTKGSVGRIQLIIFLVFLICTPIGIVTNILSIILQGIITVAADRAPAIAVIGVLLYVAFLFASSALVVPIWQSIKAVIYYDLRVRREGMGINLRK